MNQTTTLNYKHESAEAASLDFRNILKAMAYPGKICHCLSFFEQTDVDVIHPSAQQIAKVLISREVTVGFADEVVSPAREQWVRIDLRSAIVPPEQADYLFITAGQLVDFDLNRLKKGSAESPDKSTTLLVSVDHDLQAPSQRPVYFSGPGINPKTGPVMLNLDSISNSFFNKRAELVADFPLGIDLFFCSKQDFIALPRTTNVTFAGE